MSRLLLSIIPLVLLLSCSGKNYISEDSYLVTIKSENLRYSDMGFIRRGKDFVNLQLFSIGKEILKLEIDTLICLNGNCMPKSIFNSNYLSDSYPSDTLKNILLSKPIFNRKKFIKSENGFEQIFGSIYYRVSSGKTTFKDSKKAILIKLKRI